MGLAFSPVRPRACSAKRTLFFSLADRPHYRLPGYALKGSLSVQVLTKRSGPLSVRQIARTAPFVRAATPAVSSSPCAPAFSPPFPPTFFAPRDLGLLGSTPFALCFPTFSMSGLSAGFGSPRRPACPHPAARRSFPPARRFPY